MTIDVSPMPLEDVLGFRELYRQEMNCQIIHDSLPGRTLEKAGLLPCARVLMGRLSLRI